MSDTDDSLTFSFPCATPSYSTCFVKKADDVYGGRLPVHVRCLIDECANIGQIPNWKSWWPPSEAVRSLPVWSCRRRSQLKAIYKTTPIPSSAIWIPPSSWAAKSRLPSKSWLPCWARETIDTYNTGESRGRETSHSLNYQKLGKELMSQDELAVMDGGKCILQLPVCVLSFRTSMTSPAPNFQIHSRRKRQEHF